MPTWFLIATGVLTAATGYLVGYRHAARKIAASV
jgi:hypothetical protein